MALVVPDNSYLIVVEADAYFLERYGSDAWSPLSPDDKEAALISAFRYMNSLCTWLEPVPDPAPDAIKQAQCEIAYGMIEAGSSAPASSSPQVTSLKADTVSLSFSDEGKNANTPFVTDFTRNLLRPYVDVCYTSRCRMIPIVRA